MQQAYHIQYLTKETAYDISLIKTKNEGQSCQSSRMTQNKISVTIYNFKQISYTISYNLSGISSSTENFRAESEE